MLQRYVPTLLIPVILISLLAVEPFRGLANPSGGADRGPQKHLQKRLRPRRRRPTKVRPKPSTSTGSNYIHPNCNFNRSRDRNRANHAHPGHNEHSASHGNRCGYAGYRRDNNGRGHTKWESRSAKAATATSASLSAHYRQSKTGGAADRRPGHPQRRSWSPNS